MNVKGKISFFIGVIGISVCLFLKPSEPKNTVFKIACGFVVGGLIEFISYLYENRKQWNILKLHVLKASKPIRITTAYLFRIELNGKYLLIKRHKQDMVGFQPVGGAYKYLKDETQELFDDLGIEPCDKVPRDGDTENDLRIVMRKRKNLGRYLKWLSSKKNREIDPWREFYEELVEPGLLPETSFRHIKYVYIGKHQEFAIPSPAFNIDEFRYADIYELRIENDEQKKAIQALASKGGEILFASAEEIRNGRTLSGAVILPHTFKILPK